MGLRPKPRSGLLSSSRPGPGARTSSTRSAPAPYREGLELLAVGLDRFEAAIDEELRECAAGRQAGFKAVRGDYGAGKTFFSRWLAAPGARSRGFAVAEVQISRDRDAALPDGDGLPARAGAPADARSGNGGAFRSLVDTLVLRARGGGARAAEPDRRRRRAAARARSASCWSSGSPTSARTQPQFAAALRACHRRAAPRRPRDGRGADRLADGPAQCRRRRSSARRTSRATSTTTARLGFLRGLLERAQADGPQGPACSCSTRSRRSSACARDSREKSLNALRQLIDDARRGRYPGLYVLITGTPPFFDGRQGVQARCRRWRSALHTDFDERSALRQPARAADPAARRSTTSGSSRSASGSAISTRPTHPERIAAQGRPTTSCARRRREVTGKLGGKVGVAPRLFLRKLVDAARPGRRARRLRSQRALRRSWSTASEMTAEERAAAGYRAERRTTSRSISAKRAEATTGDGDDALRPAHARRSQYQIVNTLGFAEPAPGAGAHDRRGPRRRELRRPRADGRRQDRGGVLPAALARWTRRTGGRLGALPVARSAPCSTTRRSGSRALRRHDRPPRRSSGTATSARARASALRARAGGHPADDARVARGDADEPARPGATLFAGLAAVVIDEVHAFAGDDRGAHLSSLLERLSRLLRARHPAHRPLGDGGQPGARSSPGSQGQLAARRRSVVDPPRAHASRPSCALDYVGDLAERREGDRRSSHPGKKRLVFVDSPPRRRGARRSALPASASTTFVIARLALGGRAARRRARVPERAATASSSRRARWSSGSTSAISTT